MRVTVIDVDQPDRKVDGEYMIDTTHGLPAVGDELFLGARDYNDDRFYLTATVRKRRWVFFDNKPEGAILQLWIQRAGKR